MSKYTPGPWDVLRVLAAAQDLLIACKAMFDASQHGGEYTARERAALALIEAAIAKAEGRS